MRPIVLLQPMGAKIKWHDFAIFKRTVKLAGADKWVLKMLYLLTILQSILAAVQPNLFQYVLDGFVVSGSMQFVYKWFFIMLFLLLAISILGLFNAYYSSKVGQNVIYKTRLMVYGKLLRFKQGFFDKTPVGIGVTRVVSDIETLADTFASGIITIIGDLVQIIIIVVLMFAMNWKLSVATLLVLPLLLYAANYFRKGVKKSFQAVREQVAQLNGFIQEHITGMSIVKLFNKQAVEYGKFETINAKHRDAHISGVHYYSVFFPIVDVIVSLAFAILIWYGSMGIAGQFATPGQLTAFIMFINLFFRPIRTIADRFNNIQMGVVAAERIFEILDNEADLETNTGRELPVFAGNIVFDKVQFAYNPEKQVLNGVEFAVDAGSTVAIVGSTGSGKTTLLNLLSRFYNHSAGDIRIDGISINNIPLSHLRKNICTMQQDSFLFGGSILDNILLYRPDLSVEIVNEICKKLGLSSFIDGLEGGMHYQVMERGQSLSMGQRQLISFARALVANPPIIVMDEATSNIDSETEKLLQSAMNVLLKGRTALVVAHRLSTIVNADKIVVLENGSVAEIGNHLELLSKGGSYANFYNQQVQMQDL